MKKQENFTKFEQLKAQLLYLSKAAGRGMASDLSG